jgi:Fe2+ or Zn2+ uptake regulation protein
MIEIQEKITTDNISKKSDKFSVLGNEAHLRILVLLEDQPLAHDEIHDVMEEEGYYKHRETTFNALSKVVEAGFVEKNYEEDRKKLIYELDIAEA